MQVKQTNRRGSISNEGFWEGCVHCVAVSFAPINTLVFIILLALNSCLAFLSQIALTLINFLHYAVLSVYMYTALETRLLIFTIQCSGYRWDSWRLEITSPEFMQLVTGLTRGGTRGGTQTFCLQSLCSTSSLFQGQSPSSSQSWTDRRPQNNNWTSSSIVCEYIFCHFHKKVIQCNF